MATLVKQFTFVADTPILPNQVNANFDDIVSFLNTNVVHVDGSKAMTAQLELPSADPTTANQATRKSYVDALNSSQATAITNAQNTANAALPSSYINGGIALNVTSNGAGDVAVNHGLGAEPRAVVIIPYVPGGATLPWQVALEAKNSGQFNVRVFHNDPGVGIWTGVTVSFVWIAIR